MLFIASGLLCLNIVLMFFLYRKVSYNFSQSAYRDSVRGEVNKLIIDIEHESDRAITILEDKIQELHSVRAEIDKHLLLIEQEQNKWVMSSEVSEKLTKKTENAVQTNVSKDKPIRRKEIRKKVHEQPQFDYKTDINMTYKKVQPVTAIDVSGISPREQVIELTKKGFSVDFISQKVDLPVGEIALIQSMTK